MRRRRRREARRVAKHAPSKVWKFYKIEGDKLVLLKKKCPRCGSFMGEHKDRYHCGKCGFTIFKK